MSDTESHFLKIDGTKVYQNDTFLQMSTQLMHNHELG